MADVVLPPVTFSDAGLQGPKGDPGVAGPIGGTPDGSGNVTLVGVVSVTGPCTRESANSAFTAGTTQTILQMPLPSFPNRKVTVECLVSNSSGTAVQTLDASRVIYTFSGAPALAVSGTDFVYDPNGLAAVFTIDLVTISSVVYLRVTGLTAAGRYLRAAMRELF